jgi:hypothetical protein
LTGFCQFPSGHLLIGNDTISITGYTRFSFHITKPKDSTVIVPSFKTRIDKTTFDTLLMESTTTQSNVNVDSTLNIAYFYGSIKKGQFDSLGLSVLFEGEIEFFNSFQTYIIRNNATKILTYPNFDRNSKPFKNLGALKGDLVYLSVGELSTVMVGINTLFLIE